MKIGKLRTYIAKYLFGLFLLFSISVQATPNLMTFQSRIVKPDGKPLEAGTVNFRFTITDALGTCVIYQEDFANRNMSGTKGLINLTLGGGTKAYPAGPMDLGEVFNNYNFPTFNCQSGGTVNAGATDRRRLVMQFNDGSGWQTVPAMDITANPYAMQATKAYSLGDYPATDYLRTALVSTCAGGQALTFNGATFSCVAAGGAGAGTVTNVTSANTDIGVATGTSTPVLTLNSSVVGAADKIVKLDGSGNFGAINASALTNLNASNLASGTVAAGRMPALTGDVTTSAGAVATTIAANAVTSAKILDDEIVNVDIKSNAAIARTKLASGSANAVVVNDGSGVMSNLTCTSGQVLKFDGSGVPICGTDNSGSGDITNGGNTTGAAITIGTNDSQALNFETANVTKMTILANGNVGIGVTNPASPFVMTKSNSSNSSADYVGSKTTYTYSPTATTGSSVTAGDFTAVYDAGFQNDTSGNVVGLSGVSTVGGNWGNANLIGGQFSANHNQTGLGAISVKGSSSIAYVGGGSYTQIIGGEFAASSGGSGAVGTVANGFGVKSSLSNGNANTTFTNAYGVHSEVLRTAGTITNSYGVYTGSIVGTNKWSIFASDSAAPSHFAGSVGIGSGTTSPARTLHVNGPMRMNPSTTPASPAAGDIFIDSADANKLKYYDGSGWVSTGASGGGGVSNVSSSNTDIGVTNGSSTPVLALNSSVVGAADKIVKLDGSGNFGAINASALTNLNASNLASGTVAAGRMPALTGDVTTSVGAVATTIAANAVTSAKILDDEIVDADIKSSAAIARTKLASGSNNHVLINDGSGVMSSEAQLAVSRGGTGLGSYTNNALIMANGTGTALTNATCSVGEILMWNATSWACTNMASSAQGYFKDGGNTFTGTATIGTNSNHNLELETNGTTKMTILANGHVGVGTNSPATLFHISGTGNCSAGTCSNTGLACASSSDCIVKTLNGTNSGQVGIGTTAPASHLDISNASGGVMTLSRDDSTLTSNNLIGKIQFWGNDTQLTTQNIFADIQVVSAGIGTDAAEGSMVFRTTSSTVGGSPVERLRINSSGNLGVGTSNPGALNMTTYMNYPIGLHVAKQHIAIDGGADSGLILNDSSQAADARLWKAGLVGGNYVIQNINDAGIASTSLLVARNGSVAIGNISPTEKLQIDGAVMASSFVNKGANNALAGGMIGSTGAPDGAYFQFNGTNLNAQEGNAVFVADTRNVAGTAGMIRFQHYNGTTWTDRMVVDKTGNIGVGTATPEQKLDVRGVASVETVTEGTSAYVNSGASYLIPDASLSIRRITLTNNTTITLPTFTSISPRAFTMTIMLKQDATGSRTVSWAGSVGETIKWDAGVAPTISATANRITILQFTKMSDETVWYGSMVWKED